MAQTAEELISGLIGRGFDLVDHAPPLEGLREGARVRNTSEQYDRARAEGTATVVAVLRRGTDERPDSWEQSWGRPNIEVVVARDADQPRVVHGRFTAWADYSTVLVAGADRG